MPAACRWRRSTAHRDRPGVDRAAARRRRWPHPGSAGRPALGVQVRLARRRRDPAEGAEPDARLPPRAPRRPSTPTAGSTPATWRCGTTTAVYEVVGRAKELIISGGENIHPAEIENLVADRPERGRVRRGRPARPALGRGAGAGAWCRGRAGARRRRAAGARWRRDSRASSSRAASCVVERCRRRRWARCASAAELAAQRLSRRASRARLENARLPRPNFTAQSEDSHATRQTHHRVPAGPGRRPEPGRGARQPVHRAGPPAGGDAAAARRPEGAARPRRRQHRGAGDRDGRRRSATCPRCRAAARCRSGATWCSCCRRPTRKPASAATSSSPARCSCWRWPTPRATSAASCAATA